MKRFSLILALYALYGIPAAVLSQDLTTGIVRGNILDTSEAQLPIEGVLVVMVDVNGSEYEALTDNNGEYQRSNLPPGRYLLSIYKAGYGDRVGKPVTVIAGGDHYAPVKMIRKVGLIDLLQRKFVSSPWPLLFCLGGAFLLGIYVGRRTGHRSD